MGLSLLNDGLRCGLSTSYPACDASAPFWALIFFNFHAVLSLKIGHFHRDGRQFSSFHASASGSSSVPILLLILDLWDLILGAVGVLLATSCGLLGRLGASWGQVFATRFSKSAPGGGF